MTEIPGALSPDLEWEEWKGDIPFWRHTIAGSVAGIAEHVAVYPLDTIKTRLQAFSGPRPLAFIEAVRTIMAERGIYGFLRGWTAIAGGCVPAHISLFTIYETSKHCLTVNGELSSLSAAMCGALGTMAHDCILTPMDVVKQRLQLGCYKGVSDCLRRIAATEGLFSLIRSIPTTMSINAPYGAVLVAMNEKLKFYICQKENQKNYHFFVSAGLSASVASLVTHPLDVIKTRLQTQDILCKNSLKNSCVKLKYKNSISLKYPSFSVAVRKIAVEEGIRGFYRGLIPRAILSVPGAATCWGTYETVKRFLGKNIY